MIAYAAKAASLDKCDEALITQTQGKLNSMEKSASEGIKSIAMEYRKGIDKSFLEFKGDFEGKAIKWSVRSVQPLHFVVLFFKLIDFSKSDYWLESLWSLRDVQILIFVLCPSVINNTNVFDCSKQWLS